MKISRLYCDCYYTCTEKCTLASRIDSIAHRQRRFCVETRTKMYGTRYNLGTISRNSCMEC